MSFFGRALLTAAVVAGVVHVFRRDIRRILVALQKPTETFLSEVKKELESSKTESVVNDASAEKQKTAAPISIEKTESSGSKGSGVNGVSDEKIEKPLQ